MKIIRTFVPHVLFAAVAHVCFFVCLCASPRVKKTPKIVVFKESLISLPKEEIVMEEALKTQVASKQVVPVVREKSPHPRHETEKEDRKKPLIAQEKPSTSQFKEVKKNKIDQKKLQTLVGLTQALSQHLDETTERVNNTAWVSQKSVAIDSSLVASQEEVLCQLIREHVVLPFLGEVRLKITITPQGELKECVFLSHINSIDQEILLAKIRKIPFKKFSDKYTISKNITFHIKLLSNDS
ncbi:putative exported TonB protein [Chlamydia ibidis]|nr:inclusion-associated protein [Chlamydia ibidis]EPP34761.1 putative exported TonB protein [Chlamydia ibidis]